MKFIRRHDLDPQTRIEMVRLAWLNQGIYGKMTQIAQAYHISRTFLYQMTWAAHLQLEMLFSAPQDLVQDPHPPFGTVDLVVAFGREMLDSEYVLDLKVLPIPAQLRGLSQ